MTKTAALALALLLAASTAGPSVAGELSAPTGDVILEVTGAIGNHNDGAAADFDMSMLDDLLQATVTTKTPWYDGPKSFSGPLGLALLDAVGASGTMLKVTALNDYVTEIPVSDIRNYRVVLATRLDGDEMSVREKGPIFVIYPFDDHAELNNETYYGRSAWQVKSIEVE